MNVTLPLPCRSRSKRGGRHITIALLLRRPCISAPQKKKVSEEKAKKMQETGETGPHKSLSWAALAPGEELVPVEMIMPTLGENDVELKVCATVV